MQFSSSADRMQLRLVFPFSRRFVGMSCYLVDTVNDSHAVQVPANSRVELSFSELEIGDRKDKIGKTRVPNT